MEPRHNPLRECDAGERAAALSAQLPVLSRKKVIEAKEVNVNEIVVEVEKMLRSVIGDSIRLRAVLEAPPWGASWRTPGNCTRS